MYIIVYDIKNNYFIKKMILDVPEDLCWDIDWEVFDELFQYKARKANRKMTYIVLKPSEVTL